MFSSLFEALGVNGTFFVQFAIFLCFYPLLTSWLVHPYFEVQKNREKKTKGTWAEAEKLKIQEQKLQAEYERKAKEVNENFKNLYEQESQKIKAMLVKEDLQNREKLKTEMEQKKSILLKEVTEIKTDLTKEVKVLSDLVVEKLSS